MRDATKFRDSLQYPTCIRSVARMNTSRLLPVDWCARVALDDVALTVPQRCPPPLSPSSPSCRCVSGPARQLARAAARSPRASRRFPDATRASGHRRALHSPRFLPLPPSFPQVTRQFASLGNTLTQKAAAAPAKVDTTVQSTYHSIASRRIAARPARQLFRLR